MHLRPMLRSDLSEVTDLAMDAFRDDKFHRWLSPRSLEPGMEGLRRRNYYSLNLKDLVSSSAVGIVCVQPSDDDPSREKILGYAWWIRRGPSNSPTQQAYTSESQGLGLWFERTIAVPLISWYGEWIDPNPVNDYKRRRHFINMVMANDWSARLPAHWYCGFLAVSPTEQGKGVGTMLLKWGLDKADQEGIPVTLEASAAGGQVYRKRGFKCIDWSFMEIAPDLGGGDCMVYDPKMKWIRELEPGEQDYVDCAGDKRKIDATWRV